MANFFERFMEWQNYAHYLLLTGIVSAIAWKFGAPIDTKMFFQLFATILIGDSFIHALFWFAPKPFQWRD